MTAPGGAAPFVPGDFAVPRELVTELFRLEPLGPQHNAGDYDAWTSSMPHIRATPGFADWSWPMEMTAEENLGDLRRHAADYAARKGFTYTVLDPGGRVVGCVYIYPARTAQNAPAGEGAPGEGGPDGEGGPAGDGTLAGDGTAAGDGIPAGEGAAVGRGAAGVADVRSWVRADRADLDVPLYAAVSAWLADAWPFAEVRYAPRPAAGAGEPESGS